MEGARALDRRLRAVGVVAVGCGEVPAILHQAGDAGLAVCPPQVDELESRSAPLQEDRKDHGDAVPDDAVVLASVDQLAYLVHPFRIAGLLEARAGMEEFAAAIFMRDRALEPDVLEQLAKHVCQRLSAIAS